MKKIFLMLLIISLFLPAIVLAESSASVSINNSVNSYSNSNNSSTSKTDVTIETDGNKQEFHTTGNETVNWTSDDGKSSVKINSQNGGNSNVTQNSSSNIRTNINATVNSGDKNSSPSSSPSPKPHDKKPINFDTQDVFILLRQKLDMIDSFFVNFFKKLFR